MSHAVNLIQRRFNIHSLPNLSYKPKIALPAPGQILLLTGQSGAGKSTLLRSLIPKVPSASRIHIDSLRLGNLPVVDCIPLDSIEDRLNILSRVGLAEVYLWLRTPKHLSEGQRFRLKLAIALARAKSRPMTLFCDEFASSLDTLTALMISQTLRKSTNSRTNLRCILATGRDELISALKPDLHHHCNFQYFPHNI